MDVSANGQGLLERAADRLAAAVRDHWEAQAGLLELNRPQPLQVRWSTTPRAERVAAPAHTIVTSDAVTGRVVRLRLHGQLNEVAEKFLDLEHHRLVVLGEPAAAKTVLAMLLTLKLLEDRRDHPDEPVPVLLSLSSWDPIEEHLHAWIARRLGEDYYQFSPPTDPPPSRSL